jgi:hypothetical protein
MSIVVYLRKEVKSSELKVESLEKSLLYLLMGVRKKVKSPNFHLVSSGRRGEVGGI